MAVVGGVSLSGEGGEMGERVSAAKETVLFNANPAMFRNDPMRFCLFLLLCLVVIGIPLLLIWWLRCKAERITVTNLKTTQRKGLFSKHTTEIWHRDVRNVQVHQSFFQRIFGVGTIAVSSAGQGGLEIDFAGVPGPERVKKLIDSHRQ